MALLTHEAERFPRNSCVAASLWHFQYVLCFAIRQTGVIPGHRITLFCRDLIKTIRWRNDSLNADHLRLVTRMYTSRFWLQNSRGKFSLKNGVAS